MVQPIPLRCRTAAVLVQALVVVPQLGRPDLAHFLNAMPLCEKTEDYNKCNVKKLQV